MKVINVTTGETLATIVGGRNLTLEEACELVGIKIAETQEEVENEDGYCPEDLAYVND